MSVINPRFPIAGAPLLSSHHHDSCHFRRNIGRRRNLSGQTLTFSTTSEGGESDGFNEKVVGNSPNLGWDSVSSWSIGLTKDHFDGAAVGRQISPSRNVGDTSSEVDYLDSLEKDLVRQPGARGSYLKDSEKAEMYRLHKENPEVYTVERLAKDYRCIRQRVHCILWLKEQEEEEEKRLGHPLDDFVEQLLDSCLEFFVSHDLEFHVASLPYKPDFKMMPENWDRTTRDPDEVHYEISKMEDEMLYKEFVERFNFNKMKFEKKVKKHKYARRRPSDGWDIAIELLGARGKRGTGGGYRIISKADGSTRPLNDTEKAYLRRETPRRRRRILP
ncbi:GAMETE CELL DEFECTIVE 1, mitochondrial-like protein [Drosera capensis]